ncbi:outer membrane protein TolC [Vibrio cholerae]|nr:outer membrane protein TolC [Vibrio cholerae]
MNLKVPLYTGGNTTSLTKQAEFAYVAASQDLEAAYRSVVKDVRAYNNNINASIGALRAYEQAVISAKSALEATEAGFDVGTRTIVDVLDATRRLYDANKNLSNARYDYILSVLQLRQAIGTLSEQDVMDVNAGLKVAKK